MATILARRLHQIALERMPTDSPLRRLEVCQWVCLDETSFIHGVRAKDRQVAEFKWGTEMFPTKMWSGVLGERVGKDLLTALGHMFLPKKNYTWDGETHTTDGEIENFIVEIKTQTYHTPGTAGEKILGTDRKYAGLPPVAHKGVMIICVANAERIAEKSGLFYSPDLPHHHQVRNYLNYYQQIYYIRATDLVRKLVL